MKNILFIMILLFTCSCKKENPYKKAFEEKVKRNVKFRKEMIDYKLIKLSEKLEEQPSKYNEIYSLLSKLNRICNSFVNESLKIKDINKLNSIRNNTVLKIKKLKTDFPEVQKIISKLNKPITNHMDKFECIDNVNEFYFCALRVVVDKYVSDVVCGMSTFRSPKPTRVYSFRVSDTLVSLLVANNTVIDFPTFFELDDLNFKIKSTNDKYLMYHKSDCIAAYDVYTTSDTLTLKTAIKTNDNTGFLLTDDEKEIVVGDVVELNTNSKEFIEMIFNKN